MLAVFVLVLGTSTSTELIEETLELVAGYHHHGEDGHERGCCDGGSHQCGGSHIPGATSARVEVPSAHTELLATQRLADVPGGPREPHTRSLLRPPTA